MPTFTNGNSTASSTTRPLAAGIFAPLPTFFCAGTEDLDLPTLKKHVVRIAQSGCGILVCGSMGEAHHLSHTERVDVIKAAREALDEAGFTDRPIIAGTGAGSTRETIQLTKAAADAGADYAIVIPSGYFAGALGPDRPALKGFFRDVSEASSIPVMVYNFPGAAGGVDMDSDLIEEMATELPNLCGVKLTCGNVGKLTRICGTVSTSSFTQQSPRKNKNAPFLVLGGFADFILPSLYVNGHGAITGLANVAPLTLQRLWKLSVQSQTDSSVLPEAQELQGLVAHADRTIAVTNIAGTKWLMEKYKGYGGVCRQPLSATDSATGEKLWAHPHVTALIAYENRLEKAGPSSTVGKKATTSTGVAIPVSNGVTVSNTSSSNSDDTPAPATPQTPIAPSSPAHSAKFPSSVSAGVRSLLGSIRRKR